MKHSKTNKILHILAICLLLTSCGGGNKPVDPTPTPIVDPTDPDENLKKKKSAAIKELEEFVDLALYRQKEQDAIKSYISQGTKVINACTTQEQVDEMLELYEGYIMEVKTKKDYTKEAYEKCSTTEQIEAYKKEGYTNLYKDSNYKKGYIVTKPFYGAGESPYHDQYLKTYDWNYNTPIWTIAQWASNYDLLGTSESGGFDLTQDEDGLINTYTSRGSIVNNEFIPGKVIRANTKTGELYLECNTSVEYKNHRTGSEPWVHLLYSQDFENNLIRVIDQTSIVMEANFTIDKCVNKMGRAYNTNIHCAQLCWYITIQNRTGGYSNPDYGKYIWFGIPLWDNRTEGKTAGMYRAHDAGTDTLIYNLASTDIFKDNNGKQPMIGQTVQAKVDIYPFIEEAFKYAKDNGYLGNTKLEDLYIGGTNFGYEVPGTFDISSTIHSINVFYK